MPLVLSERDYKLFTLLTKITGIFMVAAGTIMLVDFGRVWTAVVLVVLGTVVALAPVPMTVVAPDVDDDEDGMLTLNE